MFFGITIISGIVLAGVSHFGIRYFKAAKTKTAAMQFQPSAELISAAGRVLMRKPGRTEWQEVKAGASLAEGDLIQTDSSGAVSIQYLDGTMVSIPEQTTLVVQYAGNRPMEIVMPPKTPYAGSQNSGVQTPAKPATAMSGIKAGKAARPSIILQRIIPYGKSLELIGRVDAGIILTVNAERVEVEGDGLFKHFTKPFPPAAGEVQLVLKAADLAGRTNVLTVTYDFGPREDN
jgi:hypothetical protein